MKFDKVSVMIGITIGVIISFVVVMGITPLYRQTTFHNEEYTGTFISYKPARIIHNDTVVSDGYFFDLKNVTLTKQGLSFQLTQTEFYFKDKKYDFEYINSFFGKNIIIGAIVDENELARIDYIREV